MLSSSAARRTASSKICITAHDSDRALFLHATSSSAFGGPRLFFSRLATYIRRHSGPHRPGRGTWRSHRRISRSRAARLCPLTVNTLQAIRRAEYVSPNVRTFGWRQASIALMRQSTRIKPFAVLLVPARSFRELSHQSNSNARSTTFSHGPRACSTRDKESGLSRLIVGCSRRTLHFLGRLIQISKPMTEVPQHVGHIASLQSGSTRQISRLRPF